MMHILVTIINIVVLTRLTHTFCPKEYYMLERSEILHDEDHRDILKGTKTVYAPESLMNCSLEKFTNGRKKRLLSCRDDNIKFQQPSFGAFYHYPEDNIKLKNIQKKIKQFSNVSLNGFGKNQKRYRGVSNIIKIAVLNATSQKDESGLDAIETKNDSCSTPYGTVTESPIFWHNEATEAEVINYQAKLMKKYMNPNIDPCTDFYEFACGNWKNFYTIPADRSSYDTFEIIRENLDSVLMQLLENRNDITKKECKKNNFVDDILNEEYVPVDKTDPHVKVRNLYKSCMQEKILAKRSYLPLMQVVNRLGGWPLLSTNWSAADFDLIWIMARLRLLNNDVLISEWIGPDMKNANQYIVHIDQTTLGLPSREYYLDPKNVKYVTAYKVLMMTVIGYMGGDRNVAEKEVDEIIAFETVLADIMASTEERKNISEIYLRTDLASMTLYFPQFDWKAYFDIVLGENVDLETLVACYCARYLHEMLYILSNTSPRLLQNYIIWRFVRHRINNLDKRFLEARQRFNSILLGKEKEPSRWQFCVTEVNAHMGMALGSLFVRKYFDTTSKDDTIIMTQELQAAFKGLLKENTWLDEYTKEYARMKVDAMDLKIGFPDFILNNTKLAERYYDVTIHPNYFFENVLSILRHMTRVEQNRLGSEVNRTTWSTPPAVVNAYYSRNKNQIMFPAGMLQPPFYHKHFPRALNFGGIGVVIGHEITHGFDDKGRLFDQAGNLYMWWRESSIIKFYEKSQCLIDQYSQFVLPEIKIALDGYMTQGENIADNGGLKEAYRAYETWLKQNPNTIETMPGLELTGKQLFFLNFAQVWCGQQRIEAAKNRLKTSVHSPGIFRVIGALSNSVEFAKVFRCPKNTAMNPQIKCIIW